MTATKFYVFDILYSLYVANILVTFLLHLRKIDPRLDS